MDSGTILWVHEWSANNLARKEEGRTRMSSNPGRDSGKSTMIGNSSLTLEDVT